MHTIEIAPHLRHIEQRKRRRLQRFQYSRPVIVTEPLRNLGANDRRHIHVTPSARRSLRERLSLLDESFEIVGRFTTDAVSQEWCPAKEDAERADGLPRPAPE